MTLEVRQLVVSSMVDDDEDDDGQEQGRGKSKASAGCGGAEGGDCEDREQLKEEILAECRQWLQAELRQLRER